MKPFDLALIGVRIVAVYLVAQSLIALPMFAKVVLSALDADFSKVLPGTFFIFVPVAVAWLLWIKAPRIAGLATLECTEGASNTRFNQEDLVASGLIIIGVYLFATSFPALIYNIPNAFREISPGAWQGRVPGLWEWFALATMKCLFGIVLILGAKSIVRNVLRFRRAGL